MRADPLATVEGGKVQEVLPAIVAALTPDTSKRTELADASLVMLINVPAMKLVSSTNEVASNPRRGVYTLNYSVVDYVFAPQDAPVRPGPTGPFRYFTSHTAGKGPSTHRLITADMELPAQEGPPNMNAPRRPTARIPPTATDKHGTRWPPTSRSFSSKPAPDQRLR